MYHQSIQLCIKKEKNKYNTTVVNMQGITANWDLGHWWDPRKTRKLVPGTLVGS